MRAAEIKFKVLETRATAGLWSAAKARALRAGAFETMEPGLALGVDLAPVERGTLFLVAQNLIGGARLAANFSFAFGSLL